MAKSKSKSKSKHKKNPKRVAAGKKAYKKTGLYKLNKKKAAKGKKKGYTKKSKAAKKSKAKTYAAGKKKTTMAHTLKMRAMVKRLEARGYTKAEAEARIKKLVAQSSKNVQEAAKRAAEKAAQQTAHSNLWANIASAGEMASMREAFAKQATS